MRARLVLYWCRSNGGVIKTPILEDAQRFYNVNVASRKIQKAPGKCKGYYVFDTEGNGKPTNGKKKRKKYSEDVRKIIYYKADGICVLCGRKILYKDMTLDHVVPIVMGGADEVKNLACTCFICNQFKGLILLDDLLDRITQIFLYQMNKKHCSNWKWKIIRECQHWWKMFCWCYYINKFT